MISLTLRALYLWWKNACFHTQQTTIDEMVFRCDHCGKHNIHGYGWR